MKNRRVLVLILGTISLALPASAQDSVWQDLVKRRNYTTGHDLTTEPRPATAVQKPVTPAVTTVKRRRALSEHPEAQRLRDLMENRKAAHQAYVLQHKNDVKVAHGNWKDLVESLSLTAESGNGEPSPFVGTQISFECHSPDAGKHIAFEKGSTKPVLVNTIEGIDCELLWGLTGVSADVELGATRVGIMGEVVAVNPKDKIVKVKVLGVFPGADVPGAVKSN